MAKFYSPTANGFFDDGLHIVLPGDAVEVSEAAWAALLADQAAGKVIVAGPGGVPESQDPPPLPLATQQAIAAARIEAEAVRRQGGLEKLRAEVNALRRKVMANEAPSQALVDRWAFVDALEADAATATAAVQQSSTPLAYPYNDDQNWTQEP